MKITLDIKTEVEPIFQDMGQERYVLMGRVNNIYLTYAQVQKTKTGLEIELYKNGRVSINE